MSDNMSTTETRKMNQNDGEQLNVVDGNDDDNDNDNDDNNDSVEKEILVM
jgi:hypothetical protein